MYMFVSQEEEDWASVMIKNGKFKDLIYSYGKVSVPQENSLNNDGTIPFRFEHEGLVAWSTREGKNSL